MNPVAMADYDALLLYDIPGIDLRRGPEQGDPVLISPPGGFLDGLKGLLDAAGVSNFQLLDPTSLEWAGNWKHAHDAFNESYYFEALHPWAAQRAGRPVRHPLSAPHWRFSRAAFLVQSPVVTTTHRSRLRSVMAIPIHMHVEDHDHPITAGLADFTIVDEPYIDRPIGSYRTVLSARYKGDAPGSPLGHWPDDPPRPQLYAKRHGLGAVIYSPLGHACGRFDLRPMMDEAPVVRAPWEEPMFQELLRRSIR